MKKINGLIKRGLICCVIAIMGLLFELIVKRPLRPVSIFLWLGVLAVGLLIIISFRDGDE